MEIAQKKFPSFVIVAFDSAEISSNINVLTDRYSSQSKPLKETKTSHHTKIVNKKFMEVYLHLVLFAILPLQMKIHKTNQNS